MRCSSTPLRKTASQLRLNDRRTAGTCARIAWLSGRGVPWRAAGSGDPRRPGAADRLALRSRRAVAGGVLEVPAQLRVVEALRWEVADVRHGRDGSAARRLLQTTAVGGILLPCAPPP